MTVRFRSLAFLIYVIIGIVVAWNRGYIFFAWIKATASILLAVFLCARAIINSLHSGVSFRRAVLLGSGLLTWCESRCDVPA